MVKYALIVMSLLQVSISEADTNRIGDGSFVAQYLDLGKGQHVVASGDFDQSGHIDLAITNLADGDAMVFLNNGHGVFAKSQRFPVGDRPTDVTTADIDGDGTIDLAVANHETSYITMLLGDGDGGFRPASHSPLTISVDPHPHAIQLHDLNGDGYLEAIVDNRDRQGLLVLPGLEGGRFQTPGVLANAGGDPYLGFAVGDIDRDGRLDVITPNARDVAVIRGAGSSRIGFTPPARIPASSPFAVAVADIDGDSDLDIIAASDDAGSLVQTFLGDGRGRFEEDHGSRFRMAVGAKRIVVGDMNGDSRQDFAVSSWSSELLVVFGGPSPRRRVEVPLTRIVHPWGLALDDLNNDGRDDLVVADGELPAAVIYVSRGE